ncbi:hypothetical protein JCM10212_005872 [Sporobolomyces blumeae]
MSPTDPPPQQPATTIDPSSSSPSPSPSSSSSEDPAVATPSLEHDIDASTLRWISGTLRHTFLPYLVYLSLFLLGSKLVRRSTPFVFRSTRVVGRWTLWVGEKATRSISNVAVWVGFVAIGVWILAGFVLALSWTLLRLKPRWTRLRANHPIRTKVVVRVVGNLTWWTMSKVVSRWTRPWLAKLVVVEIVVREAWSFVKSRDQVKSPRKSTGRVRTTSSLRSQADVDERDNLDRPTDDETVSSRRPRTSTQQELSASDGRGKIEEEDERGRSEEGDGEEAERWARRVREEMLRESLLRRGKTSGAGAGAGVGTASGSGSTTATTMQGRDGRADGE